MNSVSGVSVQSADWRPCGRTLRLCPPLLLLLLLLLSPPPAAGFVGEVAADDLSRFMEMEEWEPSEDPAAPPGTVWHNDSYLFMPAPPGRSPSCARGGMTYCNSIPTYPGEVIEKLLIRWKYDLSTVFSSENRDTLTSGIARNMSVPPSSPPRRSYGPPPATDDDPPTPLRSYGPPPAPVDDDAPMRGYSTPFASSRPRSQSQFRPIQGQRERPIGFDAGLTSSAGAANTGGYSAPVGGPSLVYTVPARRQVPPPPPQAEQQQQGYSSYRQPSNSNNWAYSFSVPSRQKRQAPGGGGQLCPTTGQFVMPRAGLNNRGEWRYLINMGELDQQYTQLIRSERCLSSQCSGLCTIPAGMTATCQQQYVQKKMVGLNPSGNEMYTDLYWIPHCCVCQIS